MRTGKDGVFLLRVSPKRVSLSTVNEVQRLLKLGAVSWPFLNSIGVSTFWYYVLYIRWEHAWLDFSPILDQMVTLRLCRNAITQTECDLWGCKLHAFIKFLVPPSWGVEEALWSWTGSTTIRESDIEVPDFYDKSDLSCDVMLKSFCRSILYRIWHLGTPCPLSIMMWMRNDKTLRGFMLSQSCISSVGTSSRSYINKNALHLMLSVGIVGRYVNFLSTLGVKKRF